MSGDPVTRTAPRGGGMSVPPRSAHHAVAYRRFVSLMKVVLPLAAVAIALLVFVWPNLSGEDLGFRLDYSSADYGVDGTVEMVNPHFQGVDRNGHPFAVTADLAARTPGEADLVALDQPKADFVSRHGEWFAVTAQRGFYDRSAERVDLIGSVSVYSGSGIEFHTERASIDLAAGDASGDDPLDGQGPWGLIEAVGFRYAGDPGRLEFFGRPQMTLFGNR